MLKKLWDQTFTLLIAIVGLWLALDLASNLLGEFLWFQHLNYLSVFLTRIKAQGVLWCLVTLASGIFLLANFSFADRWKWHENENLLPQSSPLKVRFLLTLLLGLSIIIASILFYQIETSYYIWYAEKQPSLINSLPSNPSILNYLFQHIKHVLLIILFISLISYLVLKQVFLKLIALIFIITSGFIAINNWEIVLQFLNSTSFDKIDPLHNLDISFYIFKLPFWQLLQSWLLSLLAFTVAAVAIIYLSSGNSISEGKFPGFSAVQSGHLQTLAAGLLLSIGFDHWLNRYELVYSTRGAVYGASYTDVNYSLNFQTFLAVLCFGFALKLLLFVPAKNLNKKNKGLSLNWLLIILYLISLVIANLTGKVIQNLFVEPNEITKELPYISRTIAQTREAFGLDRIEIKTFDPKDQLTKQDIENNALTINNIRLWDTQPLLKTNRQLQQIRSYYKFADADIDRYPLKLADGNLDKQQVLISPRELDYSGVPPEANTWVNQHLVYTHGYGFTLSPVNKVDSGGLPYYFVKDIGTQTEAGALKVSPELDQQTIPIGKPRIYFGELTNNYILTSTKVREFDFPVGDENSYNVYDGRGGLDTGSFWQRLVYTFYLKDWRLLLTENILPETKILFRRNINERVKAIAPFLGYDNDPYLVVASLGETKQEEKENYLHQIVEGYTKSSYYPYSDPGQGQFNYIRNSVKIVVDAYDGDVKFYIADNDDPIIKTWKKIFPELLKPLTEMPVNLKYHLRYPQKLFGVLSERLLYYHMIDPKVFYNREDQWQIPQEIYANQTQPVLPYYLIMRLPTSSTEEFILLHPYTPTSRNNLIALLFASSDEPAYGKMILYQLPKQKQIYGPEQIEALINQNPEISQQISLWNREGSRAIQGNLLVIPVEQSVIYVEPLYIEAEKNSLPTLARVVVVYEDKIVMAQTLTQAINTIFKEKA